MTALIRGTVSPSLLCRAPRTVAGVFPSGFGPVPSAQLFTLSSQLPALAKRRPRVIPVKLLSTAGTGTLFTIPFPACSLLQPLL